MSLTDALIIMLALVCLIIFNSDGSTAKGLCQTKGLELKTSSYDVETKKITVWCE